MDEDYRELGFKVLGTPMRPNDSGADTVRGYLVQLLRVLWREEQNFSGKRPFGMSHWQFEVYEALVRAELVHGSFDGDDYIETFDEVTADKLIIAALDVLADGCG